MHECPNLSKCGFFREYDQHEELGKALRGFIDFYCKGVRQDDCVRKKVSKALGDPEYVPVNMKPNGKPVIHTSDEEWSIEVKKVVFSVISSAFNS